MLAKKHIFDKSKIIEKKMIANEKFYCENLPHDGIKSGIKMFAGPGPGRAADSSARVPTM